VSRCKSGKYQGSAVSGPKRGDYAEGGDVNRKRGAKGGLLGGGQ